MSLRIPRVNFHIWATLIAFALIAAACGGDDSPGGGGDSGEPTTVRVAFGFGVDLSMPGYFVADELGFFEDEGIEVEFQLVDGSISVIQQLVSEQADIGVGGPPPNLYLGRQEGADVVSPYQIDQGGIVAMHIPADSDIQSLDDLRGTTVGVSNFGGGEVPVAKAAFEIAGLVEGEDVELLAVGESPPTVAQSLESGDIDAYAGTDSVTLGLQNLGYEFRDILPEELKALPGNFMMTTRDYVEENADIVTRFGRAFAKAMYFSSVNPEATLEMGCDFAPENCTDQAFAELALEYYVNLQQPAEFYGEFNPEGWQLAADILTAQGELPETDASEAIYPDLVEDMNDFDKEEVEQAGS